MAGFVNFTTENRSDKLWSPQGTPSENALQDYTTYWTGAPRIERILATSRLGGGNMMDAGALAALSALHGQVLALNVSAEGEYWWFEKLCIRRGPQCLVSSPITAWTSTEALVNDPDPMGTLRARFSPDDLEDMFGGTSNNAAGEMVSAKAVATFYFLQNNDVLTGGSVEDVIGEAWEEAFLDLVLQRKPIDPSFSPLDHSALETPLRLLRGGGFPSDRNPVHREYRRASAAQR